jgi:anthranilate 1,2-dioxygenase large subunit
MTAQPLIQWPLQGESRVPYRLFSGDDVYRREQERIFRGKTWTFVGLEADVPRAGDFRTAQVGDAHVVVARDADGDI